MIDESRGVSGSIASDDADSVFVELRINPRTTEFTVSFTSKEFTAKELKKFYRTFKERQFKVSGIYQRDSSEGVFALIAGFPKLRLSLCDFYLEVLPSTHVPANLWQAENLYRRIDQLVSIAPRPKARAWSLFCRSGIEALITVRNEYTVYCVDSDEIAIEDIRRNANRNGYPTQIACEHNSVVEFLSTPPKEAGLPELIILNPPKAGLSPLERHLLIQVAQKNPSLKMIYHSSNLDHACEDLKEFSAAGMIVRQMEAVSLDPLSGQLHYIATLTR